ncbi:MAG: peptide deformylase [Burkholderiaceae bacterium]|jgi:peptide deformylase|nr:peptide deformylase [Burkholderiaceae bacterium]
MALLPILIYPDVRLNKVAKPVSLFDAQLMRLLDDMAETMYDARGIGLAAPQVGIARRVIIIDVSEERQTPQIFINPAIITTDGEKILHEEGCLSVPGIYEPVERPAQVGVRAQNEFGEWFEITAEGLMSVCLQHEIDHLEGKMFVDYLSPLKRNRIKSKMRKEGRKAPPSGKKRMGVRSPMRQR